MSSIVYLRARTPNAIAANARLSRHNRLGCPSHYNPTSGDPTDRNKIPNKLAQANYLFEYVIVYFAPKDPAIPNDSNQLPTHGH